MSNISHLVADQLRDLARRFSLRTERFKEKTVQPPTPSTDGEDKSGGLMKRWRESDGVIVSWTEHAALIR